MKKEAGQKEQGAERDQFHYEPRVMDQAQAQKALAGAPDYIKQRAAEWQRQQRGAAK